MEDNQKNALRDKAYEILRQNGPMKTKKLADALGLTDARSLSMLLQWDSKRFDYSSPRWKALEPKK